MRFTIGLRWRTVKVRQEKTQSFIRRLGFFSRDRMMFGDSNLKITALMSLGIHLLIIAIVSGSFRSVDTQRSTTLHRVRVTLLPLVIQEKSKPRMIADTTITLPVPLKVGNRSQEDPAHDFKGLAEEPISPQPSVSRNIAPEKLKPVSKYEEEEETSIRPVDRTTAPGSISGGDLTPGNGGNAVPKEGDSSGGGVSVSLPFLHSGELSGNGLSYNSSGNSPGGRGGSGSGTGSGSGNGSPGNGGSGKGTGIFGKFLYAHAGGNGARPRYAQNPKPTYPQEAREKGYEGEVILRVEVLPNGRVGQIEVRNSSGYELLDRSALAAVKQWKFVPARKGETPIPLWVSIPIKFQLQ
jgi:protein TonB